MRITTATKGKAEVELSSDDCYSLKEHHELAPVFGLLNVVFEMAELALSRE